MAHEDDESDKAGDLVRQAITLIVNSPGDVDAIRDKLDHATAAQGASGVDLALAAQAATAFAGGDPHQARALLELSIGAQPHLNVGTAEPPPIRETTPTTTAPAATAPRETPDEPAAVTGPATTRPTGAEPVTELIAEPLEARLHLDAGDWALLAGAIAVGLVGVWLGLRYRPHRVKAT